MSKNTTLSVVIALSIIPLFPWLSMKPLVERFGNADLMLSSFSQVSALVGTVLFALFLISATNSKPVRYFFGKSTDTNQATKGMRRLSFALLMTHPILLLIGLVSSSSNSLLSKAGWALDFGIYAVVLLIALFVSELFAKQKHQALQSAQVAMTSILFLGTLHAFFIPSSLSENAFIKIYVLAFVSLALLLQVHKLATYFKARKVTKANSYSIS